MTAARPVRIGATAAPLAGRIAAEADEVADASLTQQLTFAADWAGRLPRPGLGVTADRWSLLASVAAVDLTVARVLEPAADALAILGEAGLSPPDGLTWGVYAAEGRAPGLAATEADGRWRFTGTKPWCSLAADVDHALVTAWVGPDRRGLFAVRMAEAGVRVEPVEWRARGLARVVSGPVTFTDVPATPVGAPGWYLERDGFAWGGLGVAAVWYGGAVAVARRLVAAARDRPPDQLALAHLGAVDLALSGARSVLAGAAIAVDGGHATGPAGELLALRVRGVVAAAAERVLLVVDHALGPAPLTLEEAHARRTADLRVYLRQHHAERDDAALGARLLGVAGAGDRPAAGAEAPW